MASLAIGGAVLGYALAHRHRGGEGVLGALAALRWLTVGTLALLVLLGHGSRPVGLAALGVVAATVIARLVVRRRTGSANASRERERP